MTDERFVCIQDIKERSKMKTGAQHKKGAKKTTSCKFPSDYLTNAQKKKLSGPMISIKMDEPYYNWKQFIKLPKDLQSSYLNGLITRYGARGIDISDMFGIHKSTLYNVCKKLDPPVKFTRSPIRLDMDERWLDFITRPGFDTPKSCNTNAKTIKKEIETDMSEEVTTKVEKPVIILNPDVPKPKFNGINDMNLTMSGPKEVIISMLETVLGTCCDYAVKIEINKL